jgi:hypothetical protein
MEKLNSTAIEQLIARYQQELEKLRFQSMKTKATINELKDGLRIAKDREASVLQEMREKHQQSTGEQVSDKSTAKPGRRSAKADKAEAKPAAKAAKTKSRRTTKKKAKKAKSNRNDRSSGYRLSPVDELVMQALDTREMALKTAELHDFASAELDKKGESMDDERLRLLISRSLQKLANRRDDIVKLRNPDERGHLYALPSWITGSGQDAKLKRKFQRGK